MARSASPPPAASGFVPLGHANTEVVLCADVDRYGTRLVTGSADHRLRVFELDEASGEWELVDAWRGHNGMILDVRFSPLASASMPLLGSAGDDLKLKLWTHDPTAPRGSGRRFHAAFSQSAAHAVAYVSLAFAAVAPSDLFLALVTRDGLLSLLEPVPAQEAPPAPANPHPLSPPAPHHKARGQDWHELDQLYVCDGPVGRGTPTSFRLAFQDAPRPNHAALAAGLHPRALSLAVAALADVRVYRIVPAARAGGAAETYRFQAPCAVLAGARALVRDVAWSPAAFRACDLIACAAADGAVRVYELAAAKARAPRAAAEGPGPGALVAGQAARAHAASGIGAGLASASEREGRGGGDGGPGGVEPGQVPHEARLVAELAHDGVWRVAWVRGGAALASTGDGGRSRVWAPALGGRWMEFAEFGPDDDKA